jgi:UDP-glucose 4-epimerase
MSKFAAERLIQAQAATSAISAITLRIFNVAGAYAGRGDVDTTRIIPNAFRAITGQLPHVTLNGDGSAMRDFVHVKDVANAVAIALVAAVDDKTNYECFNVGSGVGTSMSSVIDMVQRVTGLEVPIQRAPKKPEPQRLTADLTHITTSTNWAPTNSSLETIVRSAWKAWKTTTNLPSQ